MKKLMIFMGIMMMGFTLSACSGNSGDNLPPEFISVSIDSSNPMEAGSLKTYYKEKDSGIDVEIQLLNNSNFSIHSIVINGKNYRASRFTDVSTYSYVNFEMSSGYVIQDIVYSVDEIVYQDGDKIKTVFVEENNEFKIYVSKSSPTVERENYSLTRDSISVDFNVVDADDVIVTNTLVAELFSGETKVDEKTISVGQSNVAFTDLLANKNYEIKVKANYDLDNSFGLNTNVALYSGSFSTIANSLPSATINNFLVTSNSITFDVVYDDNDLVTQDGGISAKIFDGNTLVLQTQITGTVANIIFDELLNDNNYTLKVFSDYDLRDGHGVLIDNVLATQEFETLPRLVPETKIVDLDIEENRVIFNLEIDDPNSLIDKDTLVANMYIDGELVKTANVLEYIVDFEFYNILSNYEFLIEIEASYDLNDGMGVQTDKVILSQVLTTLNNEVPSVTVDEIVVTQGYVTIDLAVFDINETLKSSLTAILYENDIQVATLDFGLEDTQLIFSYLVKNDESYSIDIIADYNLRDGFEDIDEYILFRSLLISNGNKAPAAELINIVSTKDSITLDVNFMDIDETTEEGSLVIHLFLGSSEIDSGLLDVGINSITFDGLLSDNLYDISVTASYDLDDGAFLQVDQLLITESISTLEKEIPSGLISEENQGTESITFDLTVIDPDIVTEDNTIIAILYLDGVETGDELILNPDSLFGITFPGILSNTLYSVSVILDYDLDNGNGIIEELVIAEATIRTNKKDRPSAELINVESDKVSITFDVDVIDEHFTIQPGTLKAVLLEDGVITGIEFPLTAGVITTVVFDGILSDTRYSVRVVTDYNLNEDTDDEIDFLMDYEFINTIEKDMITAEISNFILGKTEITFDVNIIDLDSVSTNNLQAVLYKDGIATGDTITVVAGTTPQSFTGLLADSIYEVKIETDYDMNNGDGEFLGLVLTSETAITEALFLPTSVITINSLLDTEIEYEVLVTDVDETITTNLRAVLYQDGLKIDEDLSIIVGNNTEMSFDGLDFGTEYVIKIESDYNLNSGGPDITEAVLISETVSTHQIIIIEEVVEGKKLITFRVSTDDQYKIITVDQLELQLLNSDGIPVGESMTITLEAGVPLVQLYSENDYSVEVTATYDLGKGAGDETAIVYTHYFHSLPLDLPEITFLVDEEEHPLVITDTTIDFFVGIGEDSDKVLDTVTPDYLVINLYKNGNSTTVIDTITLTLKDNDTDPGEYTHGFINLDTVNNSYQMVIEGSTNFNEDNIGFVNHVYDEVAIILKDSTPPTFDSIPDQTIEAGQYTNILWTDYIINGNDNRDVLYLTTIEFVDNVDYNTPGTYTVIVQLLDGALNRTSEEFDVVVEDTITPTFVIVDQTIEAGPFTTNDLVITSIVENSDVLIFSEPGVLQVDYNTPGTYTVTVRLTDGSGNYSETEVIITVEDTTGPTFDLILDQTIDVGGLDIDWTTLITNEADNSDGVLTQTEVTDNIDYDTLGTYTVKVKVVDVALNETLQEFNVVVNDITAPTFDTIADQTIVAGVSDIDWTTFILNALDNSNGVLTMVEVSDNVDYDTPGRYPVTVKVVDESLNETLQEFNVVVS